jgi:hypothetical protein
MPIQWSNESVREGSGCFGIGQGVMLTIFKTVYTIIWTIMTTANFAAFCLALVGRFNWMFFLCVALLGGEIIVILVNSRHCPLTHVMARYTSDTAANFDIYLPERLARNNIRIFSGLIALCPFGKLA